MSLGSFRGLRVALGLPESMTYDEVAEFTFDTEAKYTATVVRGVLEVVRDCSPPALENTSSQYLSVSTLEKSNGDKIRASISVESDAMLYMLTLFQHAGSNQYRGSNFVLLDYGDTQVFKIMRPVRAEASVEIMNAPVELVPPYASGSLAQFRSELLRSLNLILN